MALHAVPQVPNELDRNGAVPFRRSVGAGEFAWAIGYPLADGRLYLEQIEQGEDEFGMTPSVYGLHAASGIRLPRYYDTPQQAEQAALAMIGALPHIDWASVVSLDNDDRATASGIVLENGGHV